MALSSEPMVSSDRELRRQSSQISSRLAKVGPHRDVSNA